MFELPSMWNMIISTIVFFVAAWYIHRYLEEQGIPKGMTRSMLVFVLASLMSWGAGGVADVIQEKAGLSTPATQSVGGLSEVLKDATQSNP